MKDLIELVCYWYNTYRTFTSGLEGVVLVALTLIIVVLILFV